MKRAHRHWEQGVKLSGSGEFSRAEAAFFKAVQECPRDPLYLLNLARAQMKTGSIDKALGNAKAALTLAPDDLVAREIAAACLKLQNRHEERATLWQQVPDDAPLNAAYYQNLGEALADAGRHQQAIGALYKALGYKIDDALSHFRLGVSFNELGFKQEATECYRTALILGLGPEGDLMAQSSLTFIERELCRWQHAVEDLEALRRMVARLPADSAAWSAVFAYGTLVDDPAEHLRVARSCARFEARGIEPFDPVPPRPLNTRLRVGFVSSDFQHHATAHLMAELLEQLDQGRFEVTLYSHGADDRSPMRERIRRCGAHFVDVTEVGDLGVAQRIRADGIEVLVDLKGHTAGSRLGIFAYRPAPVQVSFLGYPGTTGADYMDYLIGDAIVSPLDRAAHYSEKLALMPRCYQPNDRQRPRPSPGSRAQAGLPADALVLCGINQPFKLSPEVFDVWCRLMHRLPNSVLWLLEWNEHAPARLRVQAQERGIDPARLVFASKVSPQQHMSRLSLADLFLDTWPCNGHTTASDALWAGLPVITYTGDSFASRVATSLLHAIGLEDLAAPTLADYEATVMEVAADDGRRQLIRAQLIRARDSAPLFNSAQFTTDFERLLRRMAQRWSDGLAPQHFKD